MELQELEKILDIASDLKSNLHHSLTKLNEVRDNVLYEFQKLCYVKGKRPITLGTLIDELKKFKLDIEIEFIENTGEIEFQDKICLYSWRGSYDELGLEIAQNATVGELLKQCEEANGAFFDGYKGGEFLMGLYTNVWVHNYGICPHVSVVAIYFDEKKQKVIIETDFIEDY